MMRARITSIKASTSHTVLRNYKQWTGKTGEAWPISPLSRRYRASREPPRDSASRHPRDGTTKDGRGLSSALLCVASAAVDAARPSPTPLHQLQAPDGRHALQVGVQEGPPQNGGGRGRAAHLR